MKLHAQLCGKGHEHNVSSQIILSQCLLSFEYNNEIRYYLCIFIYISTNSLSTNNEMKNDVDPPPNPPKNLAQLY